MAAAATQKPNPIKIAASVLAQQLNTDVFLYNADIVRPSDQELFDCMRCMRRRENVTLILVTEGGDADAGYRIARCLQDNYAKFTCIVAGYCKSAGTLVAVGANELVMSDAAELGPLDVQMAKRDELGEWQSGLTVTSAIQAIYERSFTAFEHFFLTIKRRSMNRVTFRAATDIAARLTSGLFAPMLEHIDPMHVGEAFRATAIALHYGLRLDLKAKNLEDEESLNDLITGYPAHGFVIDRNEAQGLFKNVRPPNEVEQTLLTALGELAIYPHKTGERLFLSDPLQQQLTLNTEPPLETRSNDAATETETGIGRPDGATPPPPGGGVHEGIQGTATAIPQGTA
jgi:hypothetical protein